MSPHKYKYSTRGTWASTPNHAYASARTLNLSPDTHRLTRRSRSLASALRTLSTHCLQTLPNPIPHELRGQYTSHHALRPPHAPTTLADASARHSHPNLRRFVVRHARRRRACLPSRRTPSSASPRSTATLASASAARGSCKRAIQLLCEVRYIELSRYILSGSLAVRTLRLVLKAPS